MACLALLLRFGCLGARVQWSDGEGSAVEPYRERPAPGRPQPGYHVWRPGMDGHLPVTQRDSTVLFPTLVSGHMFRVKSPGIHLQ